MAEDNVKGVEEVKGDVKGVEEVKGEIKQETKKEEINTKKEAWGQKNSAPQKKETVLDPIQLATDIKKFSQYMTADLQKANNQQRMGFV